MVIVIKYSIFWDGTSAPLENGLSITRFLTAIEDNLFPGHLLERKNLYFFLDPTEKSNVDKKFEQELLNAGFEIVQARLIGKSDRENEMLVERLGVYREKYKDVEFILISDTQDYPRPILNFLEKNSSHCHIVQAKANLRSSPRLANGKSSGKSSFFEETEPSNLPVALVESTLLLDLSDDDDCSEASCESGEGDIIHPESWVPRYLAIIKYGRDIEKKLLESLKILDVFKGHLNSCTNGIAVVEFSSSEDLKKATPILEGLGETLGLTMTFVDETEDKFNHAANVPSRNGRPSRSSGLIPGGPESIKSRFRRRRNRSTNPGSLANYGKRYVVTITYKEKGRGQMNNKLSSTLRELGTVMTCREGMSTLMFRNGRNLGMGKKLLRTLTDFNVKIISINEMDHDEANSQASSNPSNSMLMKPTSSETKNSPIPSGSISPSGVMINPSTSSRAEASQKHFPRAYKFDPEKCKDGLFLLVKGLQKQYSISFYLTEFKRILVDIIAKPLFINAQLDWAVMGFQSEDQRRLAYFRLAKESLLGRIASNPKPVQSLPDSCIEEMKAFYQQVQERKTFFQQVQDCKIQRRPSEATVKVINEQIPNPPRSVFSLDDLKKALPPAISIAEKYIAKRQQKMAKEKSNRVEEQCAVS